MAKILIVDDEDQVRTMIRILLERAGHTTSEASDGGKALEALGRENYDIMILDLLMPEFEGLETLMALRGTQPDLKVVAISGGSKSAGVDFLPAAAKLGAASTMKKPFANDELLRVVESLLG